MDWSSRLPEQEEAKRLLASAAAAGGAHAFLLHGPAGVGKRVAAFGLAGALLGDEARVVSRTHPDLYVLEPLGEMIRIDDVRALRHDLHMRPYEGDRRVYVVLDAHRMNEDAADALLKDLEEPPAYATLVLVADELGPIPETIRSRCQLVPFRRLSEQAVRSWIAEHEPGLREDEVVALARVAGGRLDRAALLLDEAARSRRSQLLDLARAVYLEPGFDAETAAEAINAAASARGEEAKAREAATVEPLGLPAREAEQRVRRAQRGAERDHLLVSLEELASWYRDLVVVAAGAERTVVHADRIGDLRADVEHGAAEGAEDAAELVRAAWRTAEEFNVNPPLALLALFLRLRRAFAGPLAALRAD